MSDYSPEEDKLVAAPAAVVPSMAGGQTHAHLEVAGFWRRLTAAVVDTVLLGVGLMLLSSVVLVMTAVVMLIASGGRVVPTEGVQAVQMGIAIAILLVIFSWLYSAVLESSAWQATVGKRMIGITVTDLEGRPVSFGRATTRFAAKSLILLTFFIGFLMLVATGRRQGLHDMIAGTLVLSRRSSSRAADEVADVFGSTAPEYDAFISYSRAVDSKLAPALQDALHRFAKPWYRLRALRVFRDDASLSANAGLWSSIEAALGRSEFFILMASPESAGSKWVNDEVRYWLEHKPRDDILIVLTAGDIAWDQAVVDFDWTKTTALPPVLRGAIREEPRYVDLRWAHKEQHVGLSYPAFRDNVADLAATLRRRPKDELVGEDVRLHRRAVGLARAVIGALAILALLAGSAAVVAGAQRNDALHQQRIATARELTLEANALRESRPGVSMMLGVEAMRMDPSVDARASLLTTLSQSHYAGTLTGHTASIESVAVSPDGRSLATASSDRTAILWDVGDRAHVTRLATLTGHAKSVYAVAFSPGSQTLATGSGDRTVILWDVGDRAHATRLATLSGHTDSVYAVAFSPDGHTLATASRDDTAILWDVTDRAHPTRLATLTGHTDSVLEVAFSPDGHTLATASGDDTAILWDVTDRGHPNRMATLTGHTDSVYAVALSPDGHTLATASRDRTAILWDLTDRASPALLAVLSGHNSRVNAVAFSPDGRTLATVSADRTAILWNTADPLASLTGHTDSVLALSFSSDGHTLATASVDRTVILWDLTDGAHPARLATLTGHTSSVNAVALSPDGHTLATGGEDRTAILWDLADRAHPTRLATLSRHTGSVEEVAFSPDGHTLATASSDRTAILWDLTDRAHPARLATLSGHASSVDTVAFSPDGHTLATASVDRTVVVWDVTDRGHTHRLATLTGHTDSVLAVAFSPDGYTLATASRDRRAVLWDLTDRAHPNRLATLTGHTDWVYAASFSPDGKTLATASADASVILWDVGDRAHPNRLATLTGHTDSVLAVAFSPAGNTLATTSSDRTAILWDVTGVTYIAGHAVAVACALAGPSLSRSDWARYVPGIPYERVCP